MDRAGLQLGMERPPASAWDSFTIAMAASSVIVLLVTIFPSLDLLVARQFYDGNGHFAGETFLVSHGLRNVFIAIYALGCIVCVAGLVITRNRTRSLLSLGFSKWLFLALCLSVGPGVVANLALKDQSGRARPREVAELGGTKSFSAPMAPSKECVRNCSFVCGESSSMFALFFAGACVVRRRSLELIFAGLATGSAAGLVRMSQGAHFLSDVVYSAVFMALTVLALRWLFDAIARPAEVEANVNDLDGVLNTSPFSHHEVAAE